MAAVRSPRGRFLLLFTVLISFCITASLTNDKTQILKTIKKNLKYLEEKLEKITAAYEERRSIYNNGMNEFEKILDPLMKEQREQSELLPDFLRGPVNMHVDGIQASMEQSRDQVDDEVVKLHRIIVALKRELESQRRDIKWLEEHEMPVHSELPNNQSINLYL